MQKTTARLPHDLKVAVKRAARHEPDRGLVVGFTPATNRSPGASTTCSRGFGKR